MRVVLGCFGAAALVAHSAAALACGEADEPYYVVSAQLPSGKGVPLNAPLVVDLAESAGGTAESLLDPNLTLTVEGGDELLELNLVGRAPHLVWVPKKPLEPNTSYEAHFNPGYEGQPASIWQFTTGETTVPPIALEGALSAALEAGTAPTLDCSNATDCGGCVENGRHAVTKARVTLPRVKDGFSGRTGQVWLTDDTPYDFSPPVKGVADVNESHLVQLAGFVTFDDDGNPTQDVLITVPEEDAPYRPCFALRVTDDRGDSAVAESFCLEETFPRSSPKPDPVEDEPVLTDHESGSSSACSFGVTRGNKSSAALALLGLAALTRRRRSRSAL